MRKGRFFAVLFATSVALGLVGCAKPTVDSLFPAQEYPAWKIEWTLGEVVFEDKREKVMPETRRVARKDEDGFRALAISSPTEDEMKKRVRSVVVGGTMDLGVKISIVAGGAGIDDERWPKRVAHSSAKIEIEFFHRKSGNLVFKSFGEAVGEHSSYEIPADEPERLFQAAALAAFDKALVSPAVKRAFANFVEPPSKPAPVPETATSKALPITSPPPATSAVAP